MTAEFIDTVMCSACDRWPVSLSRTAFCGRFSNRSYNSHYLMISEYSNPMINSQSSVQQNCQQRLTQLFIPLSFHFIGYWEKHTVWFSSENCVAVPFPYALILLSSFHPTSVGMSRSSVFILLLLCNDIYFTYSIV